MKPLTADQQALAADPAYNQLAQRLARRFGQRYPVLADEYESEALVSLCRAAQTFAGSDPTGFREHVSVTIWADLIDLQRDWSPRGYRKTASPRPCVHSLTTAVPHPDHPNLKVALGATLAADEEPVGWLEESHQEVERLVRTLHTQQALVLRTLYGRAGAETCPKAARVLGLSRSRIHDIHATALRLLRGTAGSAG
jgi:DNA-directed RNA polymerase specialized sigma subunit